MKDQIIMYVNRLTVPMREEDNKALIEIRAALERRDKKRISNAEAVRIMISEMLANIGDLELTQPNQMELPL